MGAYLDPESKLKAIANYLAKGWVVFPIPPNSKASREDWRMYKTNPPTIDDWKRILRGRPDTNVALMTGSQSGVVVVDADDQQTEEFFEKNYPSDCYTVSATKGRKHFYYQYPPRVEHVGNAKYMQADIRGDAGYVLVFPSVVDDKLYTFHDGNMPQLPAPIYNLIRGASSNNNATTASISVSTNDAHTLGTQITDKVPWQSLMINPQLCIQYGRNNSVASIVGGMLAQKMELSTIRLAMQLWYKTIPNEGFSWDEMHNTIDSIARKSGYIDKAPNSLSEGNTTGIFDFLAGYGDISEEWDIEGFLPSATTGLVVAPPASYKSWLMLYASVCIATGMPFLGRKTTRRRVLIVQQEDDKRIIAQRIRTILGQLYNDYPPTIVETPDPSPEHPDGKMWTIYYPVPDPLIDIWDSEYFVQFADKEGSMAQLKAEIIKNKYGLVFIDPLYLSASMDNFMSEAAQHMGILKKWRDAYGVSFMILHHTKKGAPMSIDEDETDRSQLWGSQFINAWIETGWQIRPIKNDEGFLFRAHMKHVKNPEDLIIRYSIDTQESQFLVSVTSLEEHKSLSASSSNSSINTTDATISVLQELGSANIKQIVDALFAKGITIDRTTMTRKLKKLEDAGSVVRDDSTKQYTITKAHLAQLQKDKKQ